MAVNATTEKAEDLMGISFRDQVYLEMRGLSKHNVMEYFSLSKFYDKYFSGR